MAITYWANVDAFGKLGLVDSYMVSLLRRLGYKVTLRAIRPNTVLGEDFQIGTGSWWADIPSAPQWTELLSCNALWKDEAADRNRNDVPRRVVIETLVFAGLRISEFCGLDAHHLDIAAGRLRVPRVATKTDAGERVIPIVPVLRERLTEHRMDYPVAPTAPAFSTRNRTRQNPDNIRSRVLNPLMERANELLAAEGKLPIGHMTPHTLRRTFASVIAVCDVSPRRAMYLMGHTDPTLTLGVYQQVMDVSDHSLDLLEDLIGCSLDDAKTLFDGGSRRSRRRLDPGTIPERCDSGLSPERRR